MLPGIFRKAESAAVPIGMDTDLLWPAQERMCCQNVRPPYFALCSHRVCVAVGIHGRYKGSHIEVVLNFTITSIEASHKGYKPAD